MPDDNKYVYDVWKMPPGARRRALVKRYGAPVGAAVFACVVLLFLWWGSSDNEGAGNETAGNLSACHNNTGLANEPPADTPPEEPSPEPFVQPGVPVKLVRIADAGSVIVRSGGDTFRVVLAAIDAPEVGQPGYSEAVAALKRLAPDDASRVTIERDLLIGDKDTYGRLLRYLWVDGVNVNVEMVRQAHARYTGQSRYDAAFRD